MPIDPYIIKKIDAGIAAAKDTHQLLIEKADSDTLEYINSKIDNKKTLIRIRFNLNSVSDTPENIFQLIFDFVSKYISLISIKLFLGGWSAPKTDNTDAQKEDPWTSDAISNAFTYVLKYLTVNPNLVEFSCIHNSGIIAKLFRENIEKLQNHTSLFHITHDDADMTLLNPDHKKKILFQAYSETFNNYKAIELNGNTEDALTAYKSLILIKSILSRRYWQQPLQEFENLREKFAALIKDAYISAGDYKKAEIIIDDNFSSERKIEIYEEIYQNLYTREEEEESNEQWLNRMVLFFKFMVKTLVLIKEEPWNEHEERKTFEKKICLILKFIG